MATAPTTKPKRVQGPRVAKDKNVILVFKGTIESVDVCFDPWEAMEKKEADPSLTIKKVTIPAKRRSAPAQAPAA